MGMRLKATEKATVEYEEQTVTVRQIKFPTTAVPIAAGVSISNMG